MKKSNRVKDTKLFPPKINTGTIARPRLLRAFVENPNWKAAFIMAPAGYGKTVFMLQMAKSKKQPLIWYQLDAYDNEPMTFLQYLTAGFEQHVPGLEAKMALLSKNPDTDIRERTTVFINEVTRKSENVFFLVLDDYHFITNPKIHHLVLDLMHYLSNVRFLISGRTPFPSVFSRDLTNLEYLKFKAADLKFTSQEIALLMARNKVKLTNETLDELEQRTDGWAAALHLLCISTNVDIGSLANLKSEELSNFLFNEVLEQLPPEARDFLKATSVLEYFDSDFCDCFLKRKDSNKIINYLINQQLFLIPLKGPQKAYRYHHLFQQFLLEHLKPEEYRQLLQMAGDSAKESGDPNRAIEYYITAGLYEEAVQLIIEEGERAVVDGYWQRASRWLSLIPEEKLGDDPWLALLKAGTEYTHGTLDEAEKWITRAIHRFTLDKRKSGLAVAVSYKARILLSRGRYLESLKLVNSKVIKNAPTSRIDLFNVKSLAMLFAMGRLDLAISSLLKKINEAEHRKNQYMISHLGWCLCNLYYIKGDYDKALEMYQKLIRVSDDIGLINYHIQNIPTIYRDRGELDLALKMAKESVVVKERLNFLATLPYAYFELANILTDRGELKQAEEYYRRSIGTIKENGGQRFFMVLSLAFLAQCLSLQGRLAEARSTVEEALTESKGQMNYVLAISRAMAGLVLIQSGMEKEGLCMLKQAIKTFTKIGAKYPLCLCHGLLAGIMLRENKKIIGALKSVRKCLQLAAGGDYIQMFLTHQRQLEPTLRAGLELEIEVSFIQKVLLKIGQPALGLLLDLAKHRDPNIRRRVTPVLAEIGGAKARKGLQMLMEDENSDVGDFTRGFVLETMQNDKLEPFDNFNTLQIQTLGPLVIAVTGEETKPINWPIKKSRDLLAFLAHQEMPVSRERIIAEFWPNSDYQKGISLFHNTLFHLRQVLSFNKNIIIYQNGEYQIAPGSVTTDRLRFKETLLNINQLDRKTAEQLEEILLLYRGDYLEELDYAWVISEREYLKRLYLDARLKLAQYYLKIQEHLKAIEHLQILTSINPLSEEFKSLLMTAYAEIGDQSAVKQCFEAFKKELRDELGIDPPVEISKLYYRLCDPKKMAE